MHPVLFSRLLLKVLWMADLAEVNCNGKLPQRDQALEKMAKEINRKSGMEDLCYLCK